MRERACMLLYADSMCRGVRLYIGDVNDALDTSNFDFVQPARSKTNKRVHARKIRKVKPEWHRHTAERILGSSNQRLLDHESDALTTRLRSNSKEGLCMNDSLY